MMKMVRGGQALVLGLGLLGRAACLQAGVVSLDATVQAIVEGDTLKASITLTNRGDEPAYAVQVVAEGQQFSWTSPTREVLPVNEQHAVRVAQPLTALRPGRYPLVIRTQYTDANRYPFSAITVTAFTVDHEPPPAFLGVLAPLAMRQRGTMLLRLKNLTPQERTVTIRVVLPNELSVEDAVVTNTLQAHQETQRVFSVRNFSALGGSRYPVYAIVEQDEARGHQTAVIAGHVAIQDSTPLKGSRPVWLGLGAVLLTAVVAMNLRHARRRPR